MLRTTVLAFVLLTHVTMAFANDASVCGQLRDLAAAHLRWESVRKSRVDPAKHETTCRSYNANFVEAVTVRQAASGCRSGIDLQRTLELLDSEINAFNDLIATHCSG
jgi:hypothetical protein